MSVSQLYLKIFSCQVPLLLNQKIAVARVCHVAVSILAGENVMNSGIYDLVNDAALHNDAYLAKLFTHRTIEGDKLKSGDVWGNEGSSFILDLAGDKPGRWKDFGADDGGVGIIALVARRDGIKNSEALRQVADEIGYILPQEDSGRPRKTTKQKKASATQPQKTKDVDRYHWKYALPEGEKEKRPAYPGKCWEVPPTHVFSFKDENGQELYQKRRWEFKSYEKQERYCHWEEINGERKLVHTAKINGENIRRVLYRLPEILASNAGGIYVVEGEKHVDKLLELGLLATSSKDWKAEYRFANFLRGKIVYVLPDADEAGRVQALNVAKQCQKAGLRVKIVELDGLKNTGDDILDWLKIEGNTVERLQELTDASPFFDIEPPVQENFTTQISLAEDFERQYKDSLRWDTQQGYWYLWTNDIWQAVNVEYVKSLVRPICKAASDRILQSETKGAARIAALIATNSYVNGVETLCRSNVHGCTLNTSRDEDSIWDQNPFLLGVPGGVVDLRTGQLQEARREDYITKKCAVAPSEFADCPRWIQFLKDSTGDNGDFIAYLQTICGYFLTGDTSEHALFFIYGPGGNGKSVFLNILNFIVDAYAKTASMTSFIETTTEQHPTDLAMLQGARLVSVSETEKGKAWAEAKIKQLTGGDRISARFMRQDFFTFKPNFKILIIGNHKPAIQNLDDAMKRRLHLIPFMNKPTEPDPYLEDKLKEEAAGILRWMIDGCLIWQRNRLQMPEIVKDATDNYFSEEDLVEQWISQCCFTGNAQAKSSRLYSSWAEFGRQNGLSQSEIGTNKSLTATLEKKGYRRKKLSSANIFDGIGLIEPAEDENRYPD